MKYTIRKGSAVLLAGCMLLLSGFARAGEPTDDNSLRTTAKGVAQSSAVQADANGRSFRTELVAIGKNSSGRDETTAPQSSETTTPGDKTSSRTAISAPQQATASTETTPPPAAPSAQCATHSAEYATGYDDGYRNGHKTGYQSGYQTGFEAGFNAGSNTAGRAATNASGSFSGSAYNSGIGAPAGNGNGSGPGDGHGNNFGSTSDNSIGGGYPSNSGSSSLNSSEGGYGGDFSGRYNGQYGNMYSGGNATALPTDSTSHYRRFVHGLGVEFRPEYVCPTNPFLAGDNLARQPIDLSLAAHLRYSFRFQPGSRPDRIYGGAYQGIGFSYYSFDNREELGNPVAIYVFQGARIARISRRLSFNYEWNFGLSFGWKPYDAQTNRANMMMGSKINAYLNADFYFNVMLTRQLDLSAGLSMTHFSNGNTKFPNAGLNSIGMKFGLLYCFGRADDPLIRPRRPLLAPDFPRHFSYDLVLFGSWRRKGVEVGDKQYASPNAYGVAGFNFATMYNFGYKFRAGVSLDGVYDGSANVYTEDYIVQYGGGDPGYTYYTPSLDKQIALGISGRAEFVMPYFTVGIGLGVNVLHKGGDLKSFYQMLTLKIAATRRTFVHIGYCLKDFQTPNYLMLGVGFRFNNKYPILR